MRAIRIDVGGHAMAITAHMTVVLHTHSRLDRGVVHRAEAGRHVKEAAALIQIHVDLPIAMNFEVDAFEIQQVHGVVDVDQGL
jgi:hypothetical protein